MLGCWWSVRWKRNGPRQQRLVVISSLGFWQRNQQCPQIPVAIHTIGSTSLHQRIQIGAGVGTGHRIGEQPVAPSDRKRGVILPMSGKWWRSITAGMRSTVVAYDGNTGSTEQLVTWFTSRSNLE